MELPSLGVEWRDGEQDQTFFEGVPASARTDPLLFLSVCCLGPLLRLRQAKILHSLRQNVDHSLSKLVPVVCVRGGDSGSFSEHSYYSSVSDAVNDMESSAVIPSSEALKEIRLH